MVQWIYEAIYSAVGELFADINNLGIEIFDLSWVQAFGKLFTLLGWSLYVVGVVVAVFEVAIESQTGRISIKGAVLNVLKGFFAASLVGVLPVQLYQLCCTLQGVLTGDLAAVFAGEQSYSIGRMAMMILNSQFMVGETTQAGLKIIFFLLIFAYCVIKIFFANIKRGGIILVQMAVGSLYMFSVPRGYTDGFYQWCKQTIAICLTAFLQTTLLFLGIICTDSCECFDENREYLRQRGLEESNPKVRALLERDRQMLARMQAEMANAREFFFAKRFEGLKQEMLFTQINDTRKHMAEYGFEVQQLDKADIKRLLAIYFGASMDGDKLPDVDGAQYEQGVQNGTV